MEFLLAMLLVAVSAVGCLTQSMPVLKIGPPPAWLTYLTYRYRPLFAAACVGLAIWLGARWAAAGMEGWLVPGALALSGLLWMTLLVSPSNLFRPLDDGRPMPADAGFVADSQTVMGVEIDGEARAYPDVMTQPHHVILDEIGGRRIVVTWCPLCNSGMVFEGEFEGRAIAPRVVGGGNNNVLLYDPHTKNLVQQITGEIIAGPDRGARLGWIPSITTTWGSWRRQRPQTTVWWSSPGSLFRRMVRALAFWAAAQVEEKQAPFYAMARPVDRRLRFAETVSAITLGGERRAYPSSELAKQPVVNDVVGGVPVAVFSASSGSLVRFFDRRLREQVLSFQAASGDERDPVVARDRESGSGWSLEGVAVEGALHGQRLRELPGINRFYWGPFAFFYSGTSLWTAGSSESARA